MRHQLSHGHNITQTAHGTNADTISTNKRKHTQFFKSLTAVPQKAENFSLQKEVLK